MATISSECRYPAAKNHGNLTIRCLAGDELGMNRLLKFERGEESGRFDPADVCTVSNPARRVPAFAPIAWERVIAMPDSTRRNFLIAAGAGAAAVGVASALPGSADGQPAAVLPTDAQPLIAHVSDPTSGSVSLLVGEHEVTVHDPDLVARLARAAALKQREG